MIFFLFGARGKKKKFQADKIIFFSSSTHMLGTKQSKIMQARNIGNLLNPYKTKCSKKARNTLKRLANLLVQETNDQVKAVAKRMAATGHNHSITSQVVSSALNHGSTLQILPAGKRLSIGRLHKSVWGSSEVSKPKTSKKCLPPFFTVNSAPVTQDCQAAGQLFWVRVARESNKKNAPVKPSEVVCVSVSCYSMLKKICRGSKDVATKLKEAYSSQKGVKNIGFGVGLESKKPYILSPKEMKSLNNVQPVAQIEL